MTLEMILEMFIYYISATVMYHITIIIWEQGMDISCYYGTGSWVLCWRKWGGGNGVYVKNNVMLHPLDPHIYHHSSDTLLGNQFPQQNWRYWFIVKYAFYLLNPSSLDTVSLSTQSLIMYSKQNTT
jgi:hypothetical protein